MTFPLVVLLGFACVLLVRSGKHPVALAVTAVLWGMSLMTTVVGPPIWRSSNNILGAFLSALSAV